MEEQELAKQTRAELLESAKKQGLAGVSRLKKAVLIKRLLETGRKVEEKTPKVIQMPIPQPVGPVRDTKEEPTSEKKQDFKKTVVDSPKRFPVSYPEPPAFGKYRDLSQWQEKITNSKYEPHLSDSSPRTDQPSEEFFQSLESKAAKAVLMVKNPYNLYLYWDISAGDRLDHRLLVRVYDIGKGVSEADRECCYEIELEGGQSSCYICTPETDRTYYAQIGYLDRQGKFKALICSNQIHTPPIKIKKESTPVGGLPEKQFERLYRLFGQAPVRVSSIEQTADRSLEKGFESDWSSRAFGSLPLPETVSSLDNLCQSKKEKREKGFWFTLNTELILYGATEPDAQVTVLGKPVPLCKDGTFSLRFALPDGVRTIPVMATSADRVETRAITPEISRKTRP